MLEIRQLVSGYRDTKIIDSLDLTVSAGEVVCLLGRNGVGKSTLLRSLFGLCNVHGGEICLDGIRVGPAAPERMARLGLSFLPDDRGVLSNLTIAQNLHLARRVGYTPEVDVLELFPLLSDRANQPAGELSGGQKQQVGLARAILGGSRLIVVDEFSQGLQPSLAKATLEALCVLAKSGVMVLLVEQSPELPLQFADRILGMLKGRIVLDEPTAKMRIDPQDLTDLLVVT
ncbi:MAG: ABC transporter ATP-binding protein [Nocardioidaceae bacterium]